MTTSINPYAAPNAMVAEAYDDHQQVARLNLWSPRGRIGRLRYVAWGTGAYLVFAVLTGLATALFAPSTRDGASAMLVLMVIPLTMLWVFWAIQRAHDLDRSGWQVLLMLVPVLGIIWGFIWLFGRGTPGANRYGPPPPPNSLGVKILGTVMPVIFVVGILAAIALPAYSDYTKRAQAAQDSR